MFKKDESPSHRSRHYSIDEREQLANELTRLAGEFDDHSKRLRTSNEPRAPIAGMRASMARAGRLLADLVQNGAVAAPMPPPPWLAWCISPDERPTFYGFGDGAVRLAGTPSSLENLLSALSPRRESAAGEFATAQAEPSVVHDRLTFLEAISGWLGSQCTPKLHLHLPEGRFLVDPGSTGFLRDEKHITVVLDWARESIQQTALRFHDIGVACAAGCRHLAESVVSPSSHTAATVMSKMNDAAAEWRRHTRVVSGANSRPKRLLLNLSAFTPRPKGDVALLAVEVESDPHPSAETLMRAQDDPAMQAFYRVAIELAEACVDIAVELERQMLDPAPALHLRRCLQQPARLPTLEQAALIEDVLAMVDRLHLRTSHKLGPMGRPPLNGLPAVRGIAGTTSPRRKRCQSAIDDAGYDLLGTAWDECDPAHRKRPKWHQLAEAVHKALGLTTEISSTLTALKSRAPRTKEKWKLIGKEMAAEKAARVALRKK